MLRTLASSTIGSVRVSRAASPLRPTHRWARLLATGAQTWLTDEEAANAKLLEAVKSRVNQFQSAQDVSTLWTQ